VASGADRAGLLVCRAVKDAFGNLSTAIVLVPNEMTADLRSTANIADAIA